MNIVVCVKQIPDPADPYELDPETHFLVRPEEQVLDDTDRYGVEVALQLADATTGFHVRSDRYDRSPSDIFALQSEISREILRAVGVEATQAEWERIRRRATDDLAAYDLFMKGVSHFNRFTREDNQKARRLIEQALSDAFSGLSANPDHALS